MSKFRNRLVKRVMAVILSGAMVMSSMTMSGVTAYAAEADETMETVDDTRGGYSDALSEDEELKADEADNKGDENPEQEEGGGSSTSSSTDGSGSDGGTGTEPATGEGPESSKPSETTDETTEEKPEPSSSSSESSGDKGTGDEGSSVESNSSSDEGSSVESNSSSDEGSSVEDNSSDEGSSVEDNSGSDEEIDVYMEGKADLTKDLEPDTNYGDDILTFSVLEKMTHKTASSPVMIDDVEYRDYVAGTNNPALASGSDIPSGGAVFVLKVKKTSKITFLVGKSTNSTARYCFLASEGKETKQIQVSTENNAPYTFDLEAGSTYYFYVKSSKPYIYGISWQEPVPRPDWTEEFTPEILNAAIDEANPAKINVTVDAIIGEDGADKVTVYMYDADKMEENTETEDEKNSDEAVTDDEVTDVISEENYVDKIESTTVGEQAVYTFTPKKSGNYTFKAVASREDEETLYESALWEPAIAFEYVEAPWDWADWKFHVYGNGVSNSYKTDEAKKEMHTVDEEAGTVKLDVETGKIVPASNDGLAFYYTVIPSDKNFTFTANAHVDSWTFSNGQEGFGIMAADIISTDSKWSGSRVWNNSYQAVVSRISYKWNGVSISEDGSGESINMQIGVGSTEKIGVRMEDVDAFLNNEIGQPLYFRAEQKALDTTYAKFGTGQFNIVANYTNSTVEGSTGIGHVLFEDFWLQITRDKTGYAVSYAPYKCEMDSEGNYKTDSQGKAIYILDNEGNKIVDTDKITTQQYYDPDALNILDPDNIYVGVFAARHAHVTFSDMSLEKGYPDENEEVRQRPKTLINLSTSVLSGTLTNTPEYNFMFSSNWKGKLYVKNGAGEYLTQHDVVVVDENGDPIPELDANGEQVIEVDEEGNPIKDENGKDKIKYKTETINYYDVNGTLDPKVQYLQDGDDAKDTKEQFLIEDLSVGQNVFTIEYVPEKEGAWPEVEEEQAVRLKSYDTVRFTHTVEYRKYGEEGATIYVSPKGKAGNNGTQDSPLDIYTAVKYALPGQTIILAGGRYSLNRTLEIPKTVNGRPAKTDEKGNPIQDEEDYKGYIKMIGAPEDVANGNRPVLDFNSLVAAVVVVGDFWYFKNFDVIRCKDGEKGIQVSGSYGVYERVDTYRNGSTGLQICRASGTDTYSDWPKYNYILNCNSYLNVDSGQEDADGFAAKLTSGSGNVFDGCIAAFNADDGWDLFAKAQTGSIGGVVIRNSIAYRNGYLLTKDGTPDGEISEDGICVKGYGNGNGFKMGGDGLRAGSEADEDYGKDPDSKIPNVGHKLYNSFAFGNKSKGIDSNSAPNIKAYNSISFNNDGANISLDTYEDYITDTDYELQNVISIRSKDQMATSKIEADTQTFKEEGVADYTTKYSVNMVRPASGSSASASIYLSFKNIRDKAGKVKVWWRSSDTEKDCRIMLLSESDEIIGYEPGDPDKVPVTDCSEDGALTISEFETSGTEKCYLGSTDGSINIYKVEITGTRTDKTEEQTWVVDFSTVYNKTGEQTLGTKLEVQSNSLSAGKAGMGVTVQYATIPTDGVEELGQQTKSPIKDKVENDTTYYYRSGSISDGKSKNASGAGLTADNFVSLDYPYLDTVSPDHWRNADDGTINVGDFLKLKDTTAYPEDDIPQIGGTTSPVDIESLIGDEVDGSITGGTETNAPSQDFGEDYPEDGINAIIPDPNYPDDPSKGEHKYYGKVWAAPVKYLDYTSEEPINYTSKKVEPEIHVYFSADPAPLTKGKDYTIKFVDNIDAGTATAQIIGANRYKGFTTEVTFTINKIAMTDNSIAIPSVVAGATGVDPKKLIKPTWQGKTLKEGKDYTIETVDATTVKVVGAGNFGTNDPEKPEDNYRTVTIQNIDSVSPDKLISKASVKILDKNLTYTGGAVEPQQVEVKIGSTTLTKDTDYELKSANNENVGKATLIVVGKGNYVGSKNVTFNIKSGNLKDVAEVVYKTGTNKGKPFAVPESVTYEGGTCTIPVNSFEVHLIADPTKRLVKDVDYKVVQSGGNKAGNATLTIKGINNYKGALPSYKYKIDPLDINDSKVEIIYDKTLDYMVGGAKYVPGQNLYIRVNGHIVDTSNYKLSYKNNKAVGGEQPTVLVTGQKLLTGKLNTPLPFTINKAVMTDNPDFSVSTKDVITNGKDLTIGDLAKANVALKQSVNGKQKSLSSRDYNKKEIEYYIDIDNDHKLSAEEEQNPLNPTDKTKKKETITEFNEKGYLTIFAKVKGTGENYEGEVIGSFRVAKWSVAKAKVENLQPRIFGKNWKQASGVSTPITWSDTEVAKIADYIKISHKLDGKSDETLNCVDIIGAYTYDTSYFDMDGFAIVPNSYKKNDRVGTASFTIIGTGKYAGTKKVTFKIVNKAQAEKAQIW